MNLTKFTLKSSMLIVSLLFISLNISAQVRIFEESQARIVEPELKVYIRPLIADLEVLNGQERMHYGPYEFTIKSIDNFTENDLENFKATSMQRAALQSEADLIIGATFNTYIEETNPKVVKIEIFGFPAKYVNFRPIENNEQVNDYDMIRVVYPPTIKEVEENMKTRAIN